MRVIRIPELIGLTTAAPRPKVWDGEQSKDREGRPLAVVAVLLGEEVAQVTVPVPNVDKALPVHSQVVLTGVAVGNGKSGLWVSADQIQAVEA